MIWLCKSLQDNPCLYLRSPFLLLQKKPVLASVIILAERQNLAIPRCADCSIQSLCWLQEGICTYWPNGCLLGTGLTKRIGSHSLITWLLILESKAWYHIMSLCKMCVLMLDHSRTRAMVWNHFELGEKEWWERLIGALRPGTIRKANTVTLLNRDEKCALICLRLQSLVKALSEIYSEHEWHPWKFQQVPQGYWQSIDNQIQFFDWVAQQLNIQGDHHTTTFISAITITITITITSWLNWYVGSEYDQWYGVSMDTVNELGGGWLLRQHYNSSLSSALATVYPHHPWNLAKFLPPKAKR